VALALGDAVKDNIHAYTNNFETNQARYLRSIAVDYIRANKTAYNQHWKIVAADTGINMSHRAYVEYMSKPGTYGTELELAVLSFLLQRRICVSTRRPTGNVSGIIVTPVAPLQANAARRAPLYLFLANPGGNAAHYDPFIKDHREPVANTVTIAGAILNNANYKKSNNQNKLRLLYNLMGQPGLTNADATMVRREMHRLQNAMTKKPSPPPPATQAGMVNAILNGLNNTSPANQINMMQNMLASGGLSPANRKRVQNRMQAAHQQLGKATRHATQNRTSRMIEELMVFSPEAQRKALTDMMTHPNVQKNGTSRAFIKARLKQLNAKRPVRRFLR
jgi:uncharacterized membrane protein